MLHFRPEIDSERAVLTVAAPVQMIWMNIGQTPGAGGARLHGSDADRRGGYPSLNF